MAQMIPGLKTIPFRRN